jgi:hypothetical protein
VDRGFTVYNVDENGLAVVNKSGKITAPKGCKVVIMKRKSGKRSET